MTHGPCIPVFPWMDHPRSKKGSTTRPPASRMCAMMAWTGDGKCMSWTRNDTKHGCYMGVSINIINGGTPSHHPFLFVGFSLINGPFVGTPMYGHHHLYIGCIPGFPWAEMNWWLPWICSPDTPWWTALSQSNATPFNHYIHYGKSRV